MSRDRPITVTLYSVGGNGTPDSFRSAGDAVGPGIMAAIASRRTGVTPLETRWTATGRQRHVATWLGFAKIWIEEKRMVYRPRGPEPKPEYWAKQVRWRRARRRDFGTIAAVVTFDGGETAA